MGHATAREGAILRRVLVGRSRECLTRAGGPIFLACETADMLKGLKPRNQ